MFKNNAMSLFVSVGCSRDALQPAPTYRNPIVHRVAANASGSVQTTLSKLPRPHDLCVPAFLLRGSPDRDLTFPDTYLAVETEMALAERPALLAIVDSSRCGQSRQR